MCPKNDKLRTGFSTQQKTCIPPDSAPLTARMHGRWGDEYR
jgi:hypothetical protein